jgi:hypothetical protein
VTDAVTDLVEVRLVGFPLAIFERAREHHAELMREFQLLALDETGRNVPRRLVELVDELTASYGGIGVTAEAERDAALARGDESVDLTYHVPASVGEACVRLDAMLDAADAFCRSETLLTLAAADDEAAFRRWYLAEFPAQLAGAAPTPWPAFARRAVTSM